MHYDLNMLQDDIRNLGEVTSGWREYTARTPVVPPAVEPITGANFDPNSPEAAAYDYFLDKYGYVDGPDVAARFFAIHNFVMRNLPRLARHGVLAPDRQGAPMAEDLLRFLLTCFADPASEERLPHSIYDRRGGLALPFEPVMADFVRLRNLRGRLRAR